MCKRAHGHAPRYLESCKCILQANIYNTIKIPTARAVIGQHFYRIVVFPPGSALIVSHRFQQGPAVRGCSSKQKRLSEVLPPLLVLRLPAPHLPASPTWKAETHNISRFNANKYLPLGVKRKLTQQNAPNVSSHMLMYGYCASVQNQCTSKMLFVSSHHSSVRIVHREKKGPSCRQFGVIPSVAKRNAKTVQGTLLFLLSRCGGQFLQSRIQLCTHVNTSLHTSRYLHTERMKTRRTIWETLKSKKGSVRLDLALSVNLILAVVKSWLSNCRTVPVWDFYGGNCSTWHVPSLSCLVASILCLPITLSNSSSYRVDGGLQYEDIKGSHVVIHSRYFNWIPWRVTVVNQIHMESWLKAVFERPHQTRSKEELYLSDCKWLHFHCNLCVSFYPGLPPLRFLTVSSNTRHIVALCACV